MLQKLVFRKCWPFQRLCFQQFLSISQLDTENTGQVSEDLYPICKAERAQIISRTFYAFSPCMKSPYRFTPLDTVILSPGWLSPPITVMCSLKAQVAFRNQCAVMPSVNPILKFMCTSLNLFRSCSNALSKF